MYIHQLTDYLILNAYSLRNVDFYIGKAGLSLALFEAARYLQKEQIEEYAFDLLQELLILGEDKKDIGFENGLSGIGFVLLYLIEHRFLDARFEELFEEPSNRIVQQIKHLQEKSDLLSTVYFLEKCFRLTGNEEVAHSIRDILKDTEKILEKGLSDFERIDSQLLKEPFLKALTNYLKVVAITGREASPAIIHRYGELGNKGKVSSNFETAFYLNRLCQEAIPLIQEKPVLQNLEINHQRLTLTERLNTLYLLNRDTEKYASSISLLEEDLFQSSPEDFQNNLFLSIPSHRFAPGYESGVARLLLYLIYKNQKQEGKEVTRFDNLLF